MEIPLMRAREHAMMPRPLELVTPRAMFRDRAAAGRALARLLGAYRGQPGVVVIGLARAGVPVAREVADHLRAPIGVVVAHKIGVPGIEEVALGAIAEGGHRVIADSIAWYVGVPPRIVDRLVDRERMELERRAATYRAGLPSLDLRGRTVIIVDDGMATGATMRAAIRSVRDRRPARIVVAVPVAAQTSAEEVRAEVDELVVVMTPPRFNTISASYAEYSPVSDDDVFALTGETARRVSLQVRDMSRELGAALTRADAHERPVERTIGVPAFDATVAGELGVPRVRSATRWERARGVRGLVILGSGSGASRNSYIERYLAGRLRLSGYATLRVDLFTREEQHVDGPEDLRAGHVELADRLEVEDHRVGRRVERAYPREEVVLEDVGVGEDQLRLEAMDQHAGDRCRSRVVVEVAEAHAVAAAPERGDVWVVDRVDQQDEAEGDADRDAGKDVDEDHAEQCAECRPELK